ncbi:hypothetical protein [Streptomyces sp. NPDC001165]|uniref:hypothetical protein n=1 Tax=Streptomyces sp. NPDC001165 TaxID=3364546 RepID=UPI00369BB581
MRAPNDDYAVHHFKWRDSVRQDIERGVAYSADGTWRTASPARPGSPRRAACRPTSLRTVA